MVKNADFFSLVDLPPLAAHRVHLAGITDQEFSLDFIAGLNRARITSWPGYAKFCASGGSGFAQYSLSRCSIKKGNCPTFGHG